MAKTLMKGSEAIAEAAIRAGARYFFGYPITPQTEIPEYMSARMFDPDVNGCFLQAESEVAAINMIYGAAGTGARAITSSSSPGISLKQEGISYCAGAMLPCVILNVMRRRPQPSRGCGKVQAHTGNHDQKGGQPERQRESGKVRRRKCSHGTGSAVSRGQKTGRKDRGRVHQSGVSVLFDAF